MSRRLRRAVVLGFVAAACIVPDRGIQFVGGPANPGAVRILEAPALPLQWTQWCLDRDADVYAREEVEGGTGVFCPAIRPTRSGGLINDLEGDLCVCPDGQRDANAPARWSIYAEDPDLDGDEPADVLYGVLLLDPDPGAARPTAAVAYQNYMQACGAGRHLSEEEVRYREQPDDTDDDRRLYPVRVEPPVARNEAPLWAFAVDDASNDGVDLCNNDSGTALDPGLHNLQFMVTDRPFFTLERDDLVREQCGVPDIAAGATYAVVNYVFECLDGTLEGNEDRCNCEDIE